MSLSVTDDTYFVRMMESVWQVREDEDADIDPKYMEHLVKLIRHKLLDLSRDSSDEYVLRQLYMEFDTNKNGTICVEELSGMLRKL